jgi:hypothetical protein
MTDNTLSDRRFTILKNAAPQGAAHAGTVEDWEAAIDMLAKGAKRVGETHESAYARVAASGTGAAFLDCLRKSQDREASDRRGRPREHQPGAIKRSAIEEALSAAAFQIAKAENVSFEKAFTRVLETDAGSDLYTALRRLEG